MFGSAAGSAGASNKTNSSMRGVIANLLLPFSALRAQRIVERIHAFVTSLFPLLVMRVVSGRVLGAEDRPLHVEAESPRACIGGSVVEFGFVAHVVRVDKLKTRRYVQLVAGEISRS